MAKTSSQNNNTTKQKGATKTKEPLVSTRKKVGIAIYFTFLATLAGVIGLQILLNPTTTEPMPTDDPYTTTTTDSTEKTPSTPYNTTPNSPAPNNNTITTSENTNEINTSENNLTENNLADTSIPNANINTIGDSTSNQQETEYNTKTTNQNQPSTTNLITDFAKFSVFISYPIDENAPDYKTAVPF